MGQKHTVTLLMSEFVTHDTKRFLVSRPDHFEFKPGEGVELAIDRSGWSDESRPFTPTCLRDDRILEFTIKCYPSHEGVTRELHNLSAGAELTIGEPFGTIEYRGPGVFLAAGAGITPFLAILRDRARAGDVGKSSMIFSNKSPKDVICEKELRHYFDDRCTLTCTRTQAPGYENKRVDESFLGERIRDFSQPFYVCGPPGFMDSVTEALKSLGAEPQSLVFEE